MWTGRSTEHPHGRRAPDHPAQGQDEPVQEGPVTDVKLLRHGELLLAAADAKAAPGGLVTDGR